MEKQEEEQPGVQQEEAAQHGVKEEEGQHAKLTHPGSNVLGGRVLEVSFSRVAIVAGQTSQSCPVGVCKQLPPSLICSSSRSNAVCFSMKAKTAA